MISVEPYLKVIKFACYLPTISFAALNGLNEYELP